MNCRIHYLQHVHFETPALIKKWAEDSNIQITGTHLYNSEKLPELSEFDWLVVLGGPMSIFDDNKYPWLVGERNFIKQCLDANKSVLGICLGSQFIANALGAKVFSGNQKEIGWYPINYSEAYKKLIKFNPSTLDSPVFHWHGDTFDIPMDSESIGSSEAFCNQGFIYKNNVVGVQFHVEVGLPEIMGMVKNGLEELVEDEYVQSADQIMVQAARYDNSEHLHGLLNYIHNQFSK